MSLLLVSLDLGIMECPSHHNPLPNISLDGLLRINILTLKALKAFYSERFPLSERLGHIHVFLLLLLLLLLQCSINFYNMEQFWDPPELCRVFMLNVSVAGKFGFKHHEMSLPP